jgi:hypothetical protein|tara:strand:+ start:2378 stop:3244 length:867 start_codon:yes stop_codon:yes gene_type:complete
MIDKTKTPILIGESRGGSHFVGAYVREYYKQNGVLLPDNAKVNELFDESNMEGNPWGLHQLISFFEQTRNIMGMDIFNLFHGIHLATPLYMQSRPKYEIVFDWFKEFYADYPIIILRRRNIWKRYLSLTFFQCIKDAYRRNYSSWNDYYTMVPRHNIQHPDRRNSLEDTLKSTIQILKPNFHFNHGKGWDVFVQDTRFMEEHVINYYVRGKYNKLKLRNWWLEDLKEEQLKEWFISPEIRDTWIPDVTIKPYKFKYETYFDKKDIKEAKDRLRILYDKEFKHYGYEVD